MQRLLASQHVSVASASASRQRQPRNVEGGVPAARRPAVERHALDVQLRAPGSTSALSASCSSRRASRTASRLQAKAAVPELDVDDGDIPTPGYTSIEEALKHVAAGKFVVVMDDEDRENEGDLILAADKVTPETMAFMIRHTSGVVCVSLEPDRCNALNLPPMVVDKENDEKLRTAFCVTCDLKEGVTTGISAAERAKTIRALSDPASKPEMFNRPGHIFPLRYRKGGVLVRAGHTEAALDLARLAGCQPAGVLCEITNEDGTMARQPQLRDFCKKHNLPLVLISDLIRYRRKREVLVERTAVARLPTEYGVFQIHSYTSVADNIEHVAMVMGDIGDGESVLARVHSECLTGDIFSSSRCDCGPQLNLALARVAREGRGVIVYLRGQEGRGIGLGHKLQAYNLQDEGRDTVEANVDLGLPIDARDYGVGAQILKDIGVRSLRLMTNNPAKFAALAGHGLKVVGRVPLITPINPENKRYIETKRVKMGHFEGSELVAEADMIPTGPNGEEGPRFAPAGAAAQKAGLT